MINLTSGATNSVALTLNEKNSLTGNTTYLFDLFCIESNVDYVFLATDTSLFPKNYNLFNIIITGNTSQILSASTICLPLGEYNYSVYETTATTISVSATTGNVVESGLLKVWSSTETYPVTYYSGQSITKIVYAGQ